MRIKPPGDGASMTRHTSYQMFSFSLLSRGQDVLTPSYMRTVAVVNGEESHELEPQIISLNRAAALSGDGGMCLTLDLQRQTAKNDHTN